MSANEQLAKQLAGKNAVVTGASSGIGRAIALRLAAAGAKVTVHANLNLAGAQETCRLINDAGGASMPLLADISDAAACEHLLDHVIHEVGSPDIWVNNAGADVLTGAAAEWSFEEKLDHLYSVDLKGTIRLSRLVGKSMQAAPHPDGFLPSIITTGWDQAEVGMSGESGEMFAAIKGSIMAFTRSLAKSLAPHVRVNCVAPGWIKTKWGDDASDYWQDRATREALLARWGLPEDVANTVAFLVSPDAGFITGQVVAVNGGLRQSE